MKAVTKPVGSMLGHSSDSSAAEHSIKGDLSLDALQKMRAENRERKKRWRQNNEERNKDNDLRCRVNKRANKLYGEGPSEAKTLWIEEEFQRRRARRMSKENKRFGVSTQSVPTSPTFNGNVKTLLTPGNSVPTTPLPQCARSNGQGTCQSTLPPLHLPPALMSPSTSSGNARYRPYDRNTVARDFWKIITDINHDYYNSSAATSRHPSPVQSSCTSPVTMRPPDLDQRGVCNPSTTTAMPQSLSSQFIADLSRDLSQNQIVSQPSSPHHGPCNKSLTLNSGEFRLPPLHWDEAQAAHKCPKEEKLPTGMITPSSITNSPSLPPISTVFSKCGCLATLPRSNSSSTGDCTQLPGLCSLNSNSQTKASVPVSPPVAQPNAKDDGFPMDAVMSLMALSETGCSSC
ncbi:hypothetical protein IWQ62_003065 [Dispira parvispora]|uniref:DUF3020 domain-containing protein n=1 Tax=Dispira parvispora TaxID=1520584 RepID=A0A9W8AP60_9FUNG|nr:hypothetical protein IWQ62_003065 [Dispira parvispora]